MAFPIPSSGGAPNPHEPQGPQSFQFRIHHHRVRDRAAPAMREVAEFVSGEFRSIHMATRCRPATRERYEGLFRQGILKAFGGKRLDEIGASDIRAYTATLAARGVQVRGPLTLVRTVLRVAVEYGEFERFPDLPRLPREGRKLPDAPTSEEVKAMLAHANGWLQLAIALAAFAGLRMGEVRALEARDVDLERGRLLVRRALSADEVLSPKSGHERVVPLVPELRVLLAEATRERAPQARLVVNRKGRTPSRQHVLNRLKKLQERHGLPERSFHSLRHAFCSALIRRGASVEAVRLLAGHSDLKVTQRYVHATAADLEAAIGRLVG